MNIQVLTVRKFYQTKETLWNSAMGSPSIFYYYYFVSAINLVQLLDTFKHSTTEQRFAVNWNDNNDLFWTEI